MLSQRLRELLSKELDDGRNQSQLSKDLNINEGQLSCFLKKTRGIGCKKMEQMVGDLGYEILLVKKSDIGRTLHKKKVVEGERIAVIEISGIIEKFKTVYDVYVEGIDYSNGKIKIDYSRGRYIPGSTKERRKPESEQEPEKRVKYRPFDR